MYIRRDFTQCVITLTLEQTSGKSPKSVGSAAGNQEHLYIWIHPRRFMAILRNAGLRDMKRRQQKNLRITKIGRIHCVGIPQTIHSICENVEVNSSPQSVGSAAGNQQHLFIWISLGNSMAVSEKQLTRVISKNSVGRKVGIMNL